MTPQEQRDMDNLRRQLAGKLGMAKPPPYGAGAKSPAARQLRETK